MKKLIMLAIINLMILACFNISYADTYYRTFTVAEIRSNGIVLEDFEGVRLMIEKDSRGFKVGDSVRYDSVRNVLKINAWQPATVTKMGNNSVTLKLNNGDKADVKMRSSFRNELKEGDQVHYKAISGQIKKSNMQKLKE